PTDGNAQIVANSRNRSGREARMREIQRDRHTVAERERGSKGWPDQLTKTFSSALYGSRPTLWHRTAIYAFRLWSSGRAGSSGASSDYAQCGRRLANPY